MDKAQQPVQDTPLSFEQAIQMLTGIVEKIEQGQVPLQDSLQQYEKGMALIKHCRTLLHEAEQRIEVITQQDDPETDTASS